MTSLDEIELTVAEGGEIAKAIQKLRGKKVECSCGEKFVLDTFLGYAPHGCGLANSKGEKYWVYVRCPNSEHGYNWALWKIKEECGIKFVKEKR